MMDENKGLECLPDCLILDIFHRLPAKALCRFKCVSKFFLSLVEDPSHGFGSIHRETPILVQIRAIDALYVYSIDCNGVATLKYTCKFEYGTGCFRYCDGLNCCSSGNLDLLVCNPTTNERITLPRGCNSCILCFDANSKIYKVLGRVEKPDRLPLHLQVLTLERNPSWRPIMNTLETVLMREADVIVNGKPIWLVAMKRKIISFDPGKEEFGLIDLPDELSLRTSWCCVFEFEGLLSLVEQRVSGKPTFNLWILKNNNVWVMMRENITLPFEATGLHEYYARPGVECWRARGFNFSSRPGEILVVVDGLFDCHIMFIYSVLNNQFKTMKITGLPFFNVTKSNYVGNGYQMKYFVENYLCLQQLIGQN